MRNNEKKFSVNCLRVRYLPTYNSQQVEKTSMWSETNRAYNKFAATIYGVRFRRKLKIRHN